MRARGVHTFADYASVLDADAHEYDLLLDALTINVTKFFRNCGDVPRHRDDVHPGAVGVAGSGAPHLERGLRIGRGGVHARHPRATATWPIAANRRRLGRSDRDRRPTSTAPVSRPRAAAAYVEAAFAETPDELRARYFAASTPHLVHGTCGGCVRFERRDLLRDGPPAPDVHLIVCRNVVIYFDRDTQETLFQNFAEALAPGGFLVLGKVETLFGPARRAVRGRGAARAHLPAGVREIRVRVADAAAAQGDACSTTLGLGSCVAIMLHDARSQDRRAWRTSCCPASRWRGPVDNRAQVSRDRRAAPARGDAAAGLAPDADHRAPGGRREHVRAAPAGRRAPDGRAQHRWPRAMRCAKRGCPSSAKTSAATTGAACSSTSRSGQVAGALHGEGRCRSLRRRAPCWWWTTARSCASWWPTWSTAPAIFASWARRATDVDALSKVHSLKPDLVTHGPRDAGARRHRRPRLHHERGAASGGHAERRGDAGTPAT